MSVKFDVPSTLFCQTGGLQIHGRSQLRRKTARSRSFVFARGLALDNKDAIGDGGDMGRAGLHAV
jgi:hypothetical protein